MNTVVKPFRWNLAKREELGRLLNEDALPEYHESTLQIVRETCAGILAGSGDRDIVFIGRSPEMFFDYLSGIYADSPLLQRMRLANISLFWFSPNVDEKQVMYAKLSAVLANLQLSPSDIAKIPTTLVDYVYQGGTYRTLVEAILRDADHHDINRELVIRNLGLLGLTYRTHNSPNTERWYQRQNWLKQFRRDQYSSVSVDFRALGYPTDSEIKTSDSFYYSRWTDEAAAHPSHEPERIQGLQLAYQLYQTARSPQERAKFKAVANAHFGCRHSWYRDWIHQVQG